jgi:endoglucanase Acf2
VERVKIETDTITTQTIIEREVMDETFFMFCDSVGNLYTMLVDSLGNHTPTNDTVFIPMSRGEAKVVVDYRDNSAAYLKNIFSINEEVQKATTVYQQKLNIEKKEKGKWQLISFIELLIILALIILAINIYNKSK